MQDSFVHTAGADFNSAQDFVMYAADRHPRFVLGLMYSSNLMVIYNFEVVL